MMDQDSPVAVEACRVCGNRSLIPCGGLGEQYLSSLFPETLDYRQRIPRWPLDLVICDEAAPGGCGFLQLGQRFDLSPMYAAYPYTSASNSSMAPILFDVAASGDATAGLESGDTVLDIGGNDGTLLSYFRGRDLDLLCIDAAANVEPVFEHRRAHGFFGADLARSELATRPRLVFSVAMYYHLDDPLAFTRDVAAVLAPDGAWIIQMAYLPAMLATNMYDNIVHEHAGYYGVRQMAWIMDQCGLEVFDVTMNDVYGGSFRVFVQHRGGPRPVSGRVGDALAAEEDAGTYRAEATRAFFGRVERAGRELAGFCAAARAQGKTIWAYGASTKGNTILQYSGLGPDQIHAAADTNPFKVGRYMVGSDIPIEDEPAMRRARPDYLLSLPYAFTGKFMVREADLVRDGTSFIVPLPELKILPGAR